MTVFSVMRPHRLEQEGVDVASHNMELKQTAHVQIYENTCLRADRGTDSLCLSIQET